MSEIQVTWEKLIQNLKACLNRLGDYNLTLVALPLESAHLDAPRLCEELGGLYFDFDVELIQRLEDDGWEDHLNLAKRGSFQPGRSMAEELLDDIVAELNHIRPVVIGNSNLAVFYELGLGALLYHRTRDGHCILAVPGRVRGQTLLLHERHPQTGSGFTPIWELLKE